MPDLAPSQQPTTGSLALPAPQKQGSMPDPAPSQQPTTGSLALPAPQKQASTPDPAPSQQPTTGSLAPTGASLSARLDSFEQSPTTPLRNEKESIGASMSATLDSLPPNPLQNEKGNFTIIMYKHHPF